ncbi:MAG: Trm112 family protein [Candidatus Latescibacteria bacterium]|nr:Trm112 family protein [bacterium]MBD3423144.1 Trm112 family protein [Candidatus Latescibacterota bacterium]
MAVNDELLRLLACPKCKKEVRPDSAGEYIICDECGLRYPVEDDIPIMLAERAEKID